MKTSAVEVIHLVLKGARQQPVPSMRLLAAVAIEAP